MADFCKQCSIATFGSDYKDFHRLSTPEDTEKGLYCWVLCEGCGDIQVDHDGACISPFCHEHDYKYTEETDASDKED
jgi:hypothetical protein